MINKMGNNEIFEKLNRINLSNELSEKISIANQIIMESDFLEEGNLASQFANTKIMDINELQLFLSYKCGKGADSDVFKDADCDVSLISILVYCKLLNIEPNENSINFQKSFNSNSYKFEINYSSFPPIRGDTMTSIQFLLKKHIALLWGEINKNLQMKENEAYNKFYQLFNGISNRGLLLSADGINWDDVLYNNSSIVWDVLDNDIKNFLSNAWLIGNYIPMLIYINPSRNNQSGTIDTVDVLLWNIYIYYELKAQNGDLEKHLDKILSGKYKESAKVNYKIWLDMFENWDDFVVKNCLQDFVENINYKKYGRPFSMKTNQVITCTYDDIYSPISTTYEESRSFFRVLNDKILKRSERIIAVIK